MAVKIEKYERILEKFISSGKKWWKVSEDEANQVIFNAYCDSKGCNRDVLDISLRERFSSSFFINFQF